MYQISALTSQDWMLRKECLVFMTSCLCIITAQLHVGYVANMFKYIFGPKVRLTSVI